MHHIIGLDGLLAYLLVGFVASLLIAVIVLAVIGFIKRILK